jgi:hypothetical protein
MLRLLNYINNKWNNFVFYIHDITTRWGIGHTSVWFYDTLQWRLPAKWQLICGKTHEQYLLEHELYIAQHQTRYYANLAYEYQWTIIDALYPEDESEDSVEEISSKKLNTNVGTTN